MKLTEAKIKNANPGQKPYKLLDGDGLYLLVKPNKNRVWHFRYTGTFTGTGKENTISFGKYPEVSLQDARTKRFETRRLLAAGIDPSSRKQE